MFLDSVKLSKVISKIDNYAFYNIAVVDSKFTVLGLITENQIYNFIKTVDVSITLGELLSGKIK